MPSVTIRDLYVVELTELYDAERQILCELPLLAAAATADDLRHAFDEHYRRTQRHVERLEEIFRDLDERPRGTGSRGLRAIIEDARLRNSQLDRGAALDAALLALAQRLEHHEIGAYRSARMYAERIDDRSVALLDETLAEEEGMCRRLEALAAADAIGGVSRRPVVAVEKRGPSSAGDAPFGPRASFDSARGLVSH